MHIRVLTIGDIVGNPGCRFIQKRLPEFLREQQVDLTVCNAENAVAGSGLNPTVIQELEKRGVDVITTGDHVWRRREIIPQLENNPRVIRAANFKVGAPGKGFVIVPTDKGIDVAVVHLLGRVFMQPIDCPFHAVDRALKEIAPHTKVVIVEIHAEATSEKIAMGYHLDGRVSAVFGTHTHVPTADITILPEGTGYITDLGMTGPYRSVLGRRVDRVLHRFVTGMPAAFDVATEDVRSGMALFTIDSDTGRTVAAERIELRAD